MRYIRPVIIYHGQRPAQNAGAVSYAMRCFDLLTFLVVVFLEIRDFRCLMDVLDAVSGTSYV